MIQINQNQVGFRVLSVCQNQFQLNQHIPLNKYSSSQYLNESQESQQSCKTVKVSDIKPSFSQKFSYIENQNCYSTEIQTIQQNIPQSLNSLSMLKQDLKSMMEQSKEVKIEFDNQETDSKNSITQNWKSSDNSTTVTQKINKIKNKKISKNKKNDDDKLSKISTKNVPKNFVSAWANYMSNPQNEDRINIIILKNGYKLSEFRAFYQKMNNIPTIANFKTRFSQNLQNGDKKLELFAKLVRVYMFKFMREEILSYFANHKKVQKNFEMYHFKNNMMCLAYNPDDFQAVRNPFGNGKKNNKINKK